MSKHPPRVSVVMPFFNTEMFIAEAIESVMAQTYPDWELILADDGSTDSSSAIALRYAELHPERIRVVEHDGQANRGISAANNLGIRNARGEFVALLDSDDVWRPNKLHEQVPILDAHPEAGSVYGNTLYWYSWTSEANAQGNDHVRDLGVRPDTIHAPPTLLVGNLREVAAVPCTGSLLIRRALIEEVGGFEELFRAGFTDQVFYAKLFLAAPVFASSACWDKYRQHPQSCSSVIGSGSTLDERRLKYLTWFEAYLSSRGNPFAELREALDLRLRQYRHPRIHQAERAARRYRRAGMTILRDIVTRLLPASQHSKLKRLVRASNPKPGFVRFGSLRRTSPISRIWGHDRGRSLDRYYVEGFLDRHRSDIRGRVLEVGDSTYTRQFGDDRVMQADVLHVEDGNPVATIVADLASADHVASDSFDCIILTQTLQLIYDVPAALRTVRRILKPGGVLLTTFPGITHTGDADWQSTWYWSFTTNSARRLFADAFGTPHVTIESHGNVLAATAFLYGLSDDELRKDELDVHDPSYDMIIGVRAERPAA